MELALKILNLCNWAIHGGTVTKEEAKDVISATEVLFRDFSPA